MLSTTAIITIYLEIFTAGLLLGGVYSFGARYLNAKKRADLYLAAVFFTFSLFIAGNVISQIMFNLDRPLQELILAHRLIAADSLLCAVFVWLFLTEKFFKIRWISYSILSLICFFIFISFTAAINLSYRADVIEPLVQFSPGIPLKLIWIFMWGILVLAYLIQTLRAKDPRQKRLLTIGGLAGAAILASQLAGFAYAFSGQVFYLLFSWCLTFSGALGFYLSNIISPESEIALRPFSFFRTKILFKLILIFVLLLVVLFEVTSIFMINLSRNALSQSIIGEYKEKALAVASKIELADSLKSIQKIVETASFGRNKGWVYLVDQQGKLLAHPDQVRAQLREDFGNLMPVSALMQGKMGGGEFVNEEGARMVGAYVPLKAKGWGVVVEDPIKESYFVIRRVESSSLLFSIVGIMLTVFVGAFFARGIEKSIHIVMEGTQAVKEGDLDYQIPIPSLDEVGQLAEAFNKMTVQLKETQEHLLASEKLASIGTMAAGMAHEIKNPLVSLRTFTQLMPQKWQDEEYRKKFMTVMPNEIDKINKIVEHLLKFGKPSRPELSSIKINNILQEVTELLESECKKYNIKVEHKFEPLPDITGDQSQLSQVFLNIMLNAVQAMDGGGSIFIKTDVGHVIKLGKTQKYGVPTHDGKSAEISWQEGAGEGKPKPVIFVEITDTGPGIPEENLRALFDPFFTTKPMGTGMGLSITLRIIEAHQGSIKVRSQPGKGTSFIITLPQEQLDKKPLIRKRHPADGMP